MEVYIIIGMSSPYLLPDTFFNLLSFSFFNQVTEASFCILLQFCHVPASGETDHLMVRKKNFIIFFICFINNKCSRKIFRNILQCKSKLLSDFKSNSFPVLKTAIFPVNLYFIKCCICTAHQP